MSNLPSYRRAARSVPCPGCSAGAGEPCTTRTGRRSNYEHDARYEVVREPELIGYESGLKDALDLLDGQAAQGVDIATVRDWISKQHRFALRRLEKIDAERAARQREAAER